MPQTIQHIRDVITIDSASPLFAKAQAGDTLRLIARQVSLTETRNLKGVNLEIYATSFIASNGAVLNNEGLPPGTVPAAAKHGAWGGPRENGSNGGDGANGGDGSNAGAIKVVAEVMTGVSVNTQGGDAGNGMAGGNGGKGGVAYAYVRFPGQTVSVHLTNGGDGGAGGQAGRPGNGGNVTLISANFTTPPIIAAEAGEPAVGGEGGLPGGVGEYEVINQGPGTFEEPILEFFGGDDGRKGHTPGSGPQGSAGIITQLKPNSDEFWALLAAESFASDWARYRHTVGEYFFRCFMPGVANRDDYLGRAVDEFSAALRLNPLQTESSLRRNEIWNNMNPLSLPRDLDIIPHFKEYIGNLTSLGNLNATFASIGTTLLLKSSDLQVFRDLFQSQKTQSDIRVNSAMDDLEISKQEEKNLDTALQQCQKMIDSVEQQIQKAKEAMKKKKATLLGTITNVAELATAVSAVMAAAPTGGASLLAIAPHFIALSQTVYDNFQPIMKAVIDHKETETLKTAKDQLDKVKDDSAKIKATANKVTDLVKAIELFKGAKTPDNSKLLELVQKGLELAYEYLLKQQDLQVAQMRTKALEGKLASERELLEFHKRAIEQTALNEDVIRQAGLKVIRSAVAEADILLDFAFRAQRSIEIYLLKDQLQFVYFDVGRVHPDLEADCLADPGLIDELNTSYALSFKVCLNPPICGKHIRKYLEPGLDDDTMRLPLFNAPETIANFRSTMQFSFSVDVASVPKERYHTKIQNIGVAFIGAKGRGDMISCSIEHGGLHFQRMADANRSIEPYVLHARSDVIRASIRPLSKADLEDGSAPLDEPTNFKLWGRGAGGLYTITVLPEEVELHQANFTGLTAIEVWISYQFMI